LCACHGAGRRAVEGPRRCLSARAVRSFSTTAARLRICALCKISRTRGTVSLQPMAASACSNLKVTKTFGPNRWKKQLRTIIPSSKTLQRPAEGRWVTAHERMYARPLQRFHFWCFGPRWLKSSEQHEQMSIVGVLRLRAAQHCGTRTICVGAPLRLTIL
jgi:hypothetical protein